MTTYRVRVNLYKIDGTSAEEAKKSVCEILKAMPEKFITVEDASIYNDRRPLWKRLITG